jgi:hypothetical protein
MNLVPIDGGRGAKLASTTARDLRELADLVEAGRALNVVSIAQVDGVYRLETSASAFDTVALTAMLHKWALEKATR